MANYLTKRFIENIILYWGNKREEREKDSPFTNNLKTGR